MPYTRLFRPLSIAIAIFALAPGAPAAQAADAGCQLKILATVDIVTGPNGLWAIPAQIQDQTKYFVVNTNDINSSVSAAIPKEFHLSTTTSPNRLMDMAGNVYTPEMVRIPTLQIGQLVGHELPFVVDPKLGVDGMLGPDLLRNYDVELDYANGTFILIDPNHCAGKVVHWNAQAVASVPMHVERDSGHISIPVTVDGVKLTAVINTFMPDTAMNLDIAKRDLDVDLHSADVEKAGVMKGPSYSAQIYRTRFKTIDIGGITLTNPQMTLMPDMVRSKFSNAPQAGSLINTRDQPTRLPDVTLGMSVLSKLHIYIAYHENRFYLTPGSATTSGVAQ